LGIEDSGAGGAQGEGKKGQFENENLRTRKIRLLKKEKVIKFRLVSD
jgi:hypothetical protein